jgi:FkbM family methyltransferase
MPSRLLSKKERIISAFNLMEDELSKETFFNIIKCRLKGDLSLSPRPCGHPSYFVPDVAIPSNHEVFVDAGAYDGDSIRDLLNHVPGFAGKIIAFEADPKSVAVLREHVEALQHDMSRRIRIVESALGQTTGYVHFNDYGNHSSNVAENGNVRIKCTRLDDFFIDIGPTYVKMDIEGFEIQALIGGKGTIGRHAPTLCVCVYHLHDDLWEIPLYLSSIRKDYLFYLRAHEADCQQTVCYALRPDMKLNDTE